MGLFRNMLDFTTAADYNEIIVLVDGKRYAVDYIERTPKAHSPVRIITKEWSE